MSWRQVVTSLVASAVLVAAGCGADDLGDVGEIGDALKEREQIRREALRTNKRLQRQGKALREKSKRDGLNAEATTDFFDRAAGDGKRIARRAERNQRRIEDAATP